MRFYIIRPARHMWRVPVGGSSSEVLVLFIYFIFGGSFEERPPFE